MSPSTLRRLLASVAVLCVALGVVAASAILLGAERGSGAFGDSEPIGLNRLTSATVDIDLTGAGPLFAASGSGSTVFNDSVVVPGRDLAPGDRLVGAIEIRNIGSIPVRATGVIDVGSDRSLRSATEWRAWTPVGSDATCGSAPPGATTLAFTEPGSGTVELFAERPLRPGESTRRCIEIGLRFDASNTVQGRPVSWAVAVTATQAPDLADTAIGGEQ